MEEDAARANTELRMPLSESGTRPAHKYYRHDLVGCQVEDTEGRLIGNVTAVEGPMEASRLVIAAPHGEVLIPLVAEICVNVDTATKLIRVAAPEGLLELNVKQEL
jgi:16S rRNA processing protein RimM